MWGGEGGVQGLEYTTAVIALCHMKQLVCVLQTFRSSSEHLIGMSCS